MSNAAIAVLGASSLVASFLLPKLVQKYETVVALSRRAQKYNDAFGVRWCDVNNLAGRDIEDWICLAPVWVLSDYFGRMESLGVKRVVALSSTSRFTKADSSSAYERDLARRIADGEAALQSWAARKGVQCLVLRTTLIYGDGRDRNVSELARWISRWHCFPLCGAGRGLRQPLHAADVAEVCRRALLDGAFPQGAFNLAGSDTLTYREMVVRIARALKCRVWIVSIPAWLLRAGLRIAVKLPSYRHLSPQLIDRFSEDLVFDDSELRGLLNLPPRVFAPTARDLGVSVAGDGS